MKLLPTSLFGRMFALSPPGPSGRCAAVRRPPRGGAGARGGGPIGGVIERFVTSGVDARLSDRLVAMESAVRPDGSLDREQLARVTARIPAAEPWRIDVAGHATGDDFARINAPPRPAPPPRSRRPMRLEDDRAPLPFEGRLRDGLRVHGLVTTTPTAVGQARVTVAVPRREIDRPVLAALAPLAASLAILGLALGAASLFQLRVGLRPLTALRTAVEAIRQGCATRVPDDVPDELAPLARELNALADENAAALAGARATAANLAHALKTPVATLALHLREDAVAQAQLTRIEATLRHHLGRARAVATDRRAATALAPALRDLSAAIAALHGGRVRIDVDAADYHTAAI